MAVVEQTTVAAGKTGWYPDPTSQHILRYFDGAEWTDHVTHSGPTPCLGCGPAHEPSECNS